MPATIQCFIIRNDNADSVYQFVIELCLRCRVCAAELPDFIGAEIALPHRPDHISRIFQCSFCRNFSMSSTFRVRDVAEYMRFVYLATAHRHKQRREMESINFNDNAETKDFRIIKLHVIRNLVSLSHHDDDVGVAVIWDRFANPIRKLTQTHTHIHSNSNKWNWKCAGYDCV